MFFAATQNPMDGDKYRLVLEAARFADRHGFASVWVQERHFTDMGSLYPNPAMLAAGNNKPIGYGVLSPAAPRIGSRHNESSRDGRVLGDPEYTVGSFNHRLGIECHAGTAEDP
jgi:hypothetical protein